MLERLLTFLLSGDFGVGHIFCNCQFPRDEKDTQKLSSLNSTLKSPHQILTETKNQPKSIAPAVSISSIFLFAFALFATGWSGCFFFSLAFSTADYLALASDFLFFLLKIWQISTQELQLSQLQGH